EGEELSPQPNRARLLGPIEDLQTGCGVPQRLGIGSLAHLDLSALEQQFGAEVVVVGQGHRPLVGLERVVVETRLLEHVPEGLRDQAPLGGAEIEMTGGGESAAVEGGGGVVGVDASSC